MGYLACYGASLSPALFRRQAGMHSVVTVNKVPIEILPYERRIAQETERLHFFRQTFDEDILQQLGFNNPKTMALQALIQDELLNQAAQAIPLRVSPDYAMRLIQNPAEYSQELSDVIPHYIFDEQTRTINTQRLHHYLQRYKLSMGDFEKALEDALKRSIVRSMVISAFIFPHKRSKVITKSII